MFSKLFGGPLGKEELLEVLRLKKLAEEKGFDFIDLLKQAQLLVGRIEEDEPEEGEEEDTEEATQT